VLRGPLLAVFSPAAISVLPSFKCKVAKLFTRKVVWKVVWKGREDKKGRGGGRERQTESTFNRI